MMIAAFALAASGMGSGIEWSPFNLRADTLSAVGELGRLKVPENSSKPIGPTVELAFVRLRCSAAKPGPPIVYLDGGPGSSAINLGQIPSYFATFEKLREAGDVILLDQRGIGRSRPNLLFLGGERAGPDFFASKEKIFGIMRGRMIAAAEHFRKEGVDLGSYHTAQIADDVEALRVALGAPKISIVGFSYGTHLGLSVIRRHGKNLNRAVLVGTEGPDMTNKLPLEVDRQFARLQILVDADEVWGKRLPDMAGTLKKVLARFEKEPVMAVYEPPNGTPVEFTIGAFGLAHLILRDLGDVRDHPWFPLLIETMDRGDYRFLARLAGRRYAQYQAGVHAMTFLVDGASGTSRERSEQIAREAKTALFGDAMNYDLGDVAAFGGVVLGDDFRSPIRTGVPTLFISGTLDWNTQPGQADEVRRTFSRSEHLVIENAGHESMLDHPPIAEQVLKFLKGGSTNGFRLKLDPPKFLPPPTSSP